MRLAFNPFRPFLPFLAGAIQSVLADKRVFYRNAASGSLGANTTIVRASAAYVPDFEGVLKLIPSNAAAMDGMRVVYNLWNGTGTLATQTVTVVVGRQYRAAFSGTGTVVFSGAASETVIGSASGRKSSGVLEATSTSLVCTVTGTVSDAILTDVTGQSSQNPDEYVSRGVEATGPELISNGAFVENVSGFTTVGSATLVWESGEAKITVTGSGGGIKLASSITVVAGNTYKFSASVRKGTYSGSQVQLVGSNGMPSQNPINISESATTIESVFVASGTAQDATISRVGTPTGTLFFDNFSLRQCAGEYGADGLKYFSDYNGNTVVAGTVVEAQGASLPGPFSVRLEPSTSQYLLNSAAPATQTTPSLPTGAYTLWVAGSGSAAVTAGTATLTGAGTAADGSPVTFTVTVAGTVTVTVTGSLTRFQLESTAVPTSYIEATESVPVARAQDVISWPSTTPQTAGMLVIKLRPMFAPATLAASAPLVTFNATNIGNVLYLSNVSGRFLSSDGASGVAVDLAWTAAAEYLLAVRWNTALNKRQLGIKPVGSGSWTWGTEGTYDGAFASSNVIELKTSAGPIKVSLLSVYEEDKGAAWLGSNFS